MRCNNVIEEIFICFHSIETLFTNFVCLYLNLRKIMIRKNVIIQIFKQKLAHIKVENVFNQLVIISNANEQLWNYFF